MLPKVGTLHEGQGCTPSDSSILLSSESCPGFMGGAGAEWKGEEGGWGLAGEETHLMRSAESSFKYCQH